MHQEGAWHDCVNVGMTRLELATTRPPDVYANQLRYIPKTLHEDETETPPKEG